ncbi:MAG TPA: DUF4331 domain-containing protein [Planctomycetota bacterium]|nr:DUF4331 domain-containing protein [Planctomycetota bacterium]
MKLNRISRRAKIGTCLALGTLGLAVTVQSVTASSHREAPFITEHPKVDATDFYLFNSYETGRENFVTAVANYIPLQEAYGGPNYYTMDPDARYEIKFDQNGDAVEDVTFRFQFKNTLRDIALQVGNPGNTKTVSVPLRNIGPISAGNDSAVNDIETYTVDCVFTNQGHESIVPIRNAANNEKTFKKPIDNIGTKSIPDYHAYAAAHIYDIKLPDGSIGRLFVGQRDDPFVVNLGEAFDLVNLNPLGPVNGKSDVIADANVTSLILELPKSFIALPNQPIVGGWTTASLRQVERLLAQPTYANPTAGQGAFRQVSRLGSPLVNELVIGLKDKDRFNGSRPSDDAQFADYITNPTLPELLEVLFGVTAPNQFPRTDLVSVFATGVPGINMNGSFGEMLRLNTTTPAVPAAQQSNLGVLGGDLAGFPNGRRLGDDVVDMSLRVVMGVLLDLSVAPSGQLAYTDGAFVDATMFDSVFPYVLDPHPGAQ